MPGVTRVYTYRIAKPDNALQLADGLVQAGALIHKHNRWVEEVRVSADGEDVLIRLTMRGHDQWWIKKRVIYPVAALLTKTGLTLKDARLEAVDRLPDPRSTRPRASDGRSTPDPDKMIDHSDMLA